MTDRLSGKVALVTGASSGIGQATALAFARAGAKVVAASRRDAEGQETVRRIQEAGGEALFIKTDVSKAAEVEALVNKTMDTYGRLDCACNSAGVISASSLLTDVSEDEWDRHINVNLKGTWLCLKYEIPAMLKQKSGAIVNLASAASIVAFAGYAAYAATKGGILALTRSAAIEYAKSGIRINVVSPGSINTDMLNSATEDIVSQLAAAHPVGRVGEPEEVAEAVVWLCSKAASFVTGHNMLIDGGYSVQ